MEKFRIITNEGIEKEVDGIFYLYNSKYFFAYTEKQLDENEYVVFNLVQVGKEIKNTTDGPIDTGYMVGMEISDSEEWKSVQSSITKIVEDNKNQTKSAEIQYLPKDMLNTLKVLSTKTFRLAKNVVEQVFKLNVNDVGSIQNIENIDLQLEPSNEMNVTAPINIEQETNPLLNIFDESSVNLENYELLQNSSEQADNSEKSQDELELNNNVNSNEIIIDYRARFFEEQEKNQQLQEQINELNRKLENIRQLIG